MDVGLNLSWQEIEKEAVYTKGPGLVCKCTGQCTLEVQNFFVFKIDQSETIKSHMFSTSLRLTNHKQLTSK